jgi:hypothetical protein
MKPTFEELLEKARNLPPMTEDEKSEQGLNFSYGNLALTRVGCSRLAFKKLAMEKYGWSSDRFDTWSFGKEWKQP